MEGLGTSGWKKLLCAQKSVGGPMGSYIDNVECRADHGDLTCEVSEESLRAPQRLYWGHLIL